MLNIDIEEYLPDIIDVYTKMFGSQYREIIEKRVRETKFFTYHTENSIEEYIKFLERCKQKELSVRFLEEIGIDTNIYRIKSYSEEVPEVLESLITEYIGGYSGFYEVFGKSNMVGIRAFDKDVIERNPNYQNEIVKNQIKFINLLLGGEGEIVTEEEFQEFKKTDKYREIYARIQGYNEIYNRLLDEFGDYEETLEPYREAIDEVKKEEEPENSKEFKNILKYMGETETNEEILRNVFRSEKRGLYIDKNIESPIIIFIYPKCGGVQDLSLLREYCYVIETHPIGDNGKLRSGFDNSEESNPYRKGKRKYEILNRNITDIFAIRATRFLHSGDIYMLEPKELTNNVFLNASIVGIIKNLLLPFVKRYKDEIVRARITGDMQSLFDLIGEKNFENLNDSINMVDYLVSEGLLKELISPNKRKKSELVKEYRRQTRRIEKIYNDMESYRFLHDEER